MKIENTNVITNDKKVYLFGEKPAASHSHYKASSVAGLNLKLLKTLNSSLMYYHIYFSILIAEQN